MCETRGQPTEGAGQYVPGNLSGTKDRGVISPTGIAQGKCISTRRMSCLRQVPVVEMTPFCIFGRCVARGFRGSRGDIFRNS
ncbi:hypothetical protein PCA20602_04148 [Pandoraea capi]|uniref:Uncharacterized protein n=1 Tax=Pandoraea capi TaxID=2508286 RepID=A0ABY6W8X8_9BURK|nr:hypothetical protein PCA20602_04148 [Pandoraea capi]